MTKNSMNRPGGWKSYAYDQDYGFAISINLFIDEPTADELTAYNFSTRQQVKVSRGGTDPGVGLRLTRHQAFALYTGLNEFFTVKGFPTSESELVGELHATKTHLRDMRTLVLKRNKKKQTRRKHHEYKGH